MTQPQSQGALRVFPRLAFRWGGRPRPQTPGRASLRQCCGSFDKHLDRKRPTRRLARMTRASPGKVTGTLADLSGSISNFLEGRFGTVSRMADIHLSRVWGAFNVHTRTHRRWLTQAEIGSGIRAQSGTLAGSTRSRCPATGRASGSVAPINLNGKRSKHSPPRGNGKVLD